MDPPLDTPPELAPRSAAAAWSALLAAASPSRARLQAAASRRPDTVATLRAHMALLNLHPASLPPTVHIAGTKGKGSTAAMTEAILLAHGLRTLTYTSPHLCSVRERFRLCGAPADGAAWAAAFWEVHDACVAPASGAAPPPPHFPPELNFFSLLTLTCFALARAARVDALILEVGVGGLTDATNAVAEESVAVCGVTTLDWDHTEVLGATLPEIAAQKAGIFKRGVPAVAAPQRGDAMARLRAIAAHMGAPFAEAAPAALAARCGGAFPPLALSGSFQRGNAAVAVALAETFLERAPALLAARAARDAKGSGAEPPPPPPLPPPLSALLAAPWPPEARGGGAAPPPLRLLQSPPSPEVMRGLLRASWPGRAQVVALGGDAGSGGLVYLDGAHTDRSMRHAAAWFRGCLARAAAEAPSLRHEAVLVFNCPFEKDTLGLLLPLSTLPFSAALVTNVSTSKPTLTLQPRVDAVLGGFLARKRAFGDAEAVADLEAAAGAGGGGGEGGGAAADTRTWQESLRELWGAAHSDPRLQVLRTRIAQPVAEYGEEGGAASCGGGALTLPGAAPPTAILASTDAALAAIRARAAEGTRLHVLVTGSLYLVGEMLERLGKAPG